MANTVDKIADNIVVSIEYILRNDDGDVVDQSEAGEALAYLHGHGNIIPGLEQELVGLQVGEEKDVTVSASDGYGEHDPENVEAVPRTAFDAEFQLVEGMELQVEFESGEVNIARVKRVEPEMVLLDFNHPLAGEQLHFHIKVVNLRRATSAEIAHGHVHDSDDAH